MIQVFYKGFQERVLHERDMTEPLDIKMGPSGILTKPPSLPCGTGLGSKTGLWRQDWNPVHLAPEAGRPGLH